MVSNPIQQAIVLATHQGIVRGKSRSLALVRCGGLTLLKRTVLSLRREGVRRFVVVFSDPAVRESLAHDSQVAALDIVWVRDAAGHDATALRAAAAHLRGEFFVVPADRVFDPRVIRRLLEEPLDGLTLATSRATAEPNVPRSGLALRVHRSLVEHVAPADQGDTEWTQIATMGRPAVVALDELRALGGQQSMARLIDLLATRGQVRLADVGDAYWQDLYSKSGRKEAQRQLLAALRKTVDGVVARHINRRFSIAMTRWLMLTPIRPNHVTGFSLAVSIAAAVTAAWATLSNPWWLIVGAALWQLASMLDGIDGELARLKFTESKIGEWFDTLTDDVGRFAFFIGAGYGASVVTSEPIWFQLCLVGVAMQMSLAINLYRKLLRTGSGSHYALSWETKPKDTWTSRFYHRIEFMSRRDYYVFAFLCFAVAGVVPFGIVMMFATTSVILGHELLRPRQVRESFAIRPPM